MAIVAAPTKHLEFRTLVKIDGAVDDIASLAPVVERHLVRIIGDEAPATIHEYIVRPREQSVQIGLRFRGLPTADVERVAPEISIDAVADALDEVGVDRLRARIWSTSLAGA